MAIKLFGATYSTCTQRVMLVLETLGLQYEWVNIDMMKGEHKDPGFVKDGSPFGRIPALHDESLSIFESRAICRYLIAKYASGGSELALPTQPKDVAVFEQMASVEYSYFDPSVTKLAYEKLFKKMMGHGETDAATVAKLESNLKECLDYYEKHLSGQEYLVGSHATVVDLLHVSWLAFLPRLGLEDELTSRKNVQAWSKKLQDRPGWQAVSKKAAH